MNNRSDILTSEEFSKIKLYIKSTEFNTTEHARIRFLIRTLIYYYFYAINNQEIVSKSVIAMTDKLKYLYLKYLKNEDVTLEICELFQEILNKSHYYNGYKIDYYKDRDKNRNKNTLKMRYKIYIFVVDMNTDTVITVDVADGKEVSNYIYWQKNINELESLIQNDLNSNTMLTKDIPDD